MRATLSVIALLGLIACAAASPYFSGPCHKPMKWTPKVTTKMPHETMDVSAIPTNWDWRNANGKNMVTVTRNQHLPQYCGSCWAFAATSALGDRIKIASSNQWPEVNLAPQVLLNCGNAGTCGGGDSGAAYQYIAQNGITDETCAPYQAIDLNCTAINVCKTCAPDFSNPAKKCVAQKPNRLWKVSQFGSVSGVQQMMAEIYARGPITCAIAVTQPFVNYNGGIFVDNTGAKTPDHEISLVGFGVDPTTNQQYWIGRNSWGTPWGELGFFRIVRGVDNLGIESNGCNWAVPIVN